MKKKLLYIVLTAFVTLAACDFEVSDNGDLEGYWQLQQTDTLATGGTTDMRYSGIYWAVQVHLMELRNVQGNTPNILFRFDHSGNHLRIYNPIADSRQVSDSVISDTSTLRPYGIEHLDETLNVEELSSERMVLTNESYRFHLRKY
jgi:hypothetical protein